MLSSLNEKKTKLLSSVLMMLFIGASVTVDRAAATGARMVRLCIASVDPVKLSSQCVMCNRRDFPLTAIDCTGMTKMNDLIANPLSVAQALCLINNCRKQVPHIKPEPYHGSVTQAARANYPIAAGSRNYEMMPPSMYGNYPASQSMTRYSSAPYSSSMRDSSSMPARLASDAYGMSSDNGAAMGMPPGAAGLPYALVPAPYIPSPFGSRKFKAALVPLFKRR